ncbi:hypothetical protein [Streptosporangium sp. NPDC006007]|uniref:hypothetical protein n=1 Tax=Streptosporangium sp. NPDC006007 TaxID=3154575 RepID=UPI0033BF40AA
MPEEDLNSTLHFLLNGKTPRWRQKETQEQGEIREQRSQQVRSKRAEMEEALRGWGYNYRERDKKLRGTPKRPAQQDNKKTYLRFAHYIDADVDWSSTDLDREQVIASWRNFVGDDVNLAVEWRDAGVPYLAIGKIEGFLAEGFSADDLHTQVHGKTVLEHLLAGNSVRWCAAALQMRRAGQV